MTTETDSELVSRSRRGDLAAFELIVTRHRAALVALAAARLGSLADAEDVAQEAFIRAYFHLHQLRQPEALLAWLRRVTERLALMWLRRRHEEPAPPERLEQWQAVPPAEETGKSTELLQQLPEAMRQAVTLTYLAGYSCAEAAALLGVCEGTVKSRLSRARAKLKEALGVVEEELNKGRPKEEFTQETVARLKQEARRLAEEGDPEAASPKADEAIAAQLRASLGTRQLRSTAERLAAYDGIGFKVDDELVQLKGLGWKVMRRRECEANAAQYGFRLEELDWELEDVNAWTGTLGRSVGHGKDVWGIPLSRQQIALVDARELCQELQCSPLLLNDWVEKGCPILRCWPFARFDLERVRQWLQTNQTEDWPKAEASDLELPIRVLFRAVYDGVLSPERADEVMRNLGYGVWELPIKLGGMR